MSDTIAVAPKDERPTAVDDNEQKKRALEILRVSAAFLTQNQTSIRNNLFPFIVFSVLGYVAVVPSAIIKEKELLGSAIDKVMYGIPVTPIAISICLSVIFMRFGFLLFHGLDLASSNKNLIVKTKFSPDEEDVLLQSFKDAYLIDTFLIFLNKPSAREETRIGVKRLAAILMNIILICSLLYAQYIVILALHQKSVAWSYVFSAIYVLLFAVFASKVVDLARKYPDISEPAKAPRYLIYGIYGALPLLSAVVSFRTISG